METLLKKVTENDTEILKTASEIIKNGGQLWEQLIN